ncbi:MAG TPA: VWA-like domain-containing protein [Polyangiales bacterium]
MSQDLRAWLDAFVHEQHFLARYPYYAHLLARVQPVLDPSVPAMGVSLHAAPGRGPTYYLHVNIDALLQTPQYLRGILLHEVHHIALGHLAHPKFFGAAHKDLMQIAQETSANEHIVEPLPEPVLWQHYEKFGLRAGQSTLERYQRLCEARAEGREPKPQRQGQTLDEHSWLEGPPPPGGVTETRDVIQHTRERGVDDAERARQAPKEQAQRAQRIAGHTPEQLLAQLGGTHDVREFELDWRAALCMFVAQTRAPAHTWSRPSRRFPSRIGVVPGRSYQRRPALRPSLLVALDTSLSMSERELTEVALQLAPLSELAQLWVFECDVRIARSYPFQGRLDHVKGRGGTDLRPIFEPDVLRAHRADGVVYFTDGDGPYPNEPPGLPVLWILTKPNDFTCPWGARAKLSRTP